MPARVCALQDKDVEASDMIGPPKPRKWSRTPRNISNCYASSPLCRNRKFFIKTEDVHGDAVHLEKPKQERPVSLAPNAASGSRAPRWRIKEQKGAETAWPSPQGLWRAPHSQLHIRGNPKSPWATGASPPGAWPSPPGFPSAGC